MSIIRATAYPSRYACQACEEQTEDVSTGMEETRWEESMRGKILATFEIVGPSVRSERAQREIAQTLGMALGEKAIYRRAEKGSAYFRGDYEVGGWHVRGYFVSSELFDINSMPRVLRALQALSTKGYVPDGTFTLGLMPERYDLDMIVNTYTILEARRKLIELALGFEDELQFMIGQGLAFSFPLDSFSLPVIEACACLLSQISIMAMSTRKARMKPCDMSNPKYQMRSWLLRLGFIGEQFERPRQTLLERLDGNAAFFDEGGKQRARDKRRQHKALTLV